MRVGIGAKIIVPYFFLTLVVASLGSYIVASLVTSTLRERFTIQLLDAGRVVSESMIRYEDDRLQTLRLIVNTQGIPQALAAGDRERLANLSPQIIVNSNTHAVELIDMEGIEVYGWQYATHTSRDASTAVERSGTDFSQLEDVRLVLDGFIDELGDKRLILSDAPGGLMLFTVGPVMLNGEQVGAAMVGTYVRYIMTDLSLNAVAHVTLYDRQGQVIDTTLGRQEDILATLQEAPDVYDVIVTALRETPEQYRVVVENAEQTVPLWHLRVLGQDYMLAYGDWRLRGQSFGLFSVALSTNVIVTDAYLNRDRLTFFFTVATLAVFVIGFFTARGITGRLRQLVQTAIAVGEGNLDRRSGIEGHDEVAQLASSFDLMTERLFERNRKLLEQTSELEAILYSIADGVVVLNADEQIVTTNLAAQRLFADMSYDFSVGPLREMRSMFSGDSEAGQVTASYNNQQPKRYKVGNRVLSALASPVQSPEGEQLGTVIILRDVTREVEAEHLKDAFITSISHELRTPLTVIKVYTDLMLKTANGHLDERQLKFIHNINKGSEQLERHINQLINISEIQAGTLNLEKETIDLASLIAKVADHWRERMISKGLTFEVILPETKLCVQADPNHLSWALENLLSNAHNYTLAGGEVIVKAFQENEEEARLDVCDTGIGIAAADQPHLFDRFFRASNAVNYDVRGVGLGLYITRSVIELHDGRIWVNSKSGEGSTFSIALPLSD